MKFFKILFEIRDDEDYKAFKGFSVKKLGGGYFRKTSLDGKYIEYCDDWGMPHRTDGPAIIDKREGKQEWFIHDERHRIGKPAVMYDDGGEEWWVNGRLHRLDGPAVTHKGSYPKYEWWVEGKLHRIEGPAVVYSDDMLLQKDTEEYWVNGKKLTKKEFDKHFDV